MKTRLYGENTGRLRFKAAVSAVSLMMAAALGLGQTSAWARLDVQGQPETMPARPAAGLESLAPDSPEQRQLFEALNQRMRQTSANYNHDISGMSDPFFPITAVRETIEDNAGGEPISMQYKLVAITMINNGSEGLAGFEDSLGASHILRVGDKIGRNHGRVIKITGTTVTVEERGRRGDMPPRITEIKLPGPDTRGLTRGSL